MAEGLLDQGQIHIAGHQMRRERTLEAVRVPFLVWQAGGAGNRLEQAEEGCAIEPPALLRREEEV